MNLPHLPLVILDTETTGFIPKVNHIIEFASVRIEEGKIVDEYETLISVPGEIPDLIQAITRIKNTDLINKKVIDNVREEIQEHIGTDTIIVGQNIGFDMRMLKGEGIDIENRPWIDTSMIASLVFPECASYSLSYISQILKLNHEPVHRALGDVHATLELLEKCWERLLEIPEDLIIPMRVIMQKAPEGYQRFFAALPEKKGGNMPKWLLNSEFKIQNFKSKKEDLQFTTCPSDKWTCNLQPFKKNTSSSNSKNSVHLIEEPIDSELLTYFLEHKSDQKQWIAVKNLHATLLSTLIPHHVTVIHPPWHMLDTDAVVQLANQKIYTNDEALLALKLAWYEPKTYNDAPIHGGEKNVWSAKIASTIHSKKYQEQFEKLSSTVLIDHKQLLEILADPTHPGHKVLTKDVHIIIDDASMMEDTATKAYGWYCATDNLRAAAENNNAFAAFVDMLQVWMERIRQGQETVYISKQNLEAQDAKGLLKQCKDIQSTLPSDTPVYKELKEIQNMLDPSKIHGRIAWIETKQDGAQTLHSVPEQIGIFLQTHLYQKIPTSLLIPPKSASYLREILPLDTQTHVSECARINASFNLLFDPETIIENIFKNPPPGKTIALIGSKNRIEQIFINHVEELEAQGITLICQGTSGGQGRMQADFSAHKNVIWILTPWAFEGIELSLKQIDNLYLDSLPFDHPKHTVLAKRAEHYRDAFTEYSLPRLQCRLYRILRTFNNYCNKNANVTVLDKRLDQKKYGRDVWEYLQVLTKSEVIEKTENTEGEKDVETIKSPEEIKRTKNSLEKNLNIKSANKKQKTKNNANDSKKQKPKASHKKNDAEQLSLF